MINSTTALNFLNSKKITLIKYRPEFKSWEIYDNKGFLSSDFNLLKAIDKCVNIFVFKNPERLVKEKGDKWVVLGDGDGYWEKISHEDDLILEHLINKKQDLRVSGRNWYFGGFNLGTDIRKIINI